MNIQNLAGEQIASQLLYERQKALRSNHANLPGPTVVADGLQTPENVGGVLRLADAAGSVKVIFLHDGNPTAYPLHRIQRTARNTAVFVVCEFWTQAKFLAESHTLQPLLALEITTASTNIFETVLPLRCTFVIGNERHGIASSLLAQCQRAVHIPMVGVNGSMNVTHALAVALFEWRRQQAIVNQSTARG